MNSLSSKPAPPDQAGASVGEVDRGRPRAGAAGDSPPRRSRQRLPSSYSWRDPGRDDAQSRRATGPSDPPRGDDSGVRARPAYSACANSRDEKPRQRTRRTSLHLITFQPAAGRELSGGKDGCVRPKVRRRSTSES